MDLPPSRFLDDIPGEVLEIRRERTQMDNYRSGGFGSDYGAKYSSGSGYPDSDFSPPLGRVATGARTLGSDRRASPHVLTVTLSAA